MLDMAPGTSNMLRARRKDINVKPNRRLDRKSSRGMLFENEELRLRTININAEVEKGHSDIKKLRKENEHLRREIWGLRDEYDRLETLLKKRSTHESEDEEYDREEEEDGSVDDEEDDEEEEEKDKEDQDNAENQQKATTGLHADFDGLSVVDEEAEGGSVDADQGAAPPYCGTITLPDGRQGVFFSDAMAAPRRKVNGAGPSPEEYEAFLAEHGTCYEDAAPDLYVARGGPDVFVSGAYPDSAFPSGGDLDQLLREVRREHEAATSPAARASSVEPREVIDALESQLGDCSCVRGVRAQPGECYICVSQQQEVRGLLRAGLNLRGQHLPLRDVTRDSLLVCLAGVPHHVDDSTVVLLANNFGTVISEVERRTYKGVDTGERLLRIKPHASSDAIPPSIVLAGSSVEVKVLEPHDFDVLDDADMPQLEPPPDQQTACSSSDNSFGVDSRFRSQLNVRLKLPDTSPMPSPPPPPFFQTLPACRRAPPWPAIDPPQPTVPSNPFAADYQATLPCGARLHTPDVAGNPFTFPQVTAGYFEQEEALTYMPPEETTPHRAPPSGDSAPVSSPSSPAADKRPSKKASIAVQQSETSTPPGAPAGRRDKLPRKTSSASQGVADVEAAAGGPSATSTPSARKKSANRKVSAAVAGDPVVDLSRCSSSSGQDSPTKSERRRRVSIHFNKRSVCSRKDSVAVGNGTGQQRSVSLEQARVRLEAGDGTTTSERERTNSVSSKSSSAVGGVRRNHAARDLELVDRKVPWCGCWGNGCI